MNLKDFKDEKVLLLGKSRAFDKDEFEAQLKSHKIVSVNQFDADVSLIIDGKMMTPYEQNESDRLYESYSKDKTFISIDELEKELAKHIDADTLLMSLKLSKNKERLKSFIQNSMIDDELFFRLLKMYSWRGEDFFENDDNRDASAALILRFYKNIERNHNVQYAASGILHLISQSHDEKLIRAVAELEPLQKSMHTGGANENILLAIAVHPSTPKDILGAFIKKGGSKLKAVIAMRDDCDDKMQEMLYSLDDKRVTEALCESANLSKELFFKLYETDMYAKKISKNMKLDDELFETLIKRYPKETAQNRSLSLDMQTKLCDLDIHDVDMELAKNVSLHVETAKRLLQKDKKDLSFELYANKATSSVSLEEAYEDAQNHIALAGNENTPVHILTRLGESQDKEILKALAKNVNTPVELLYQLQLDSRVARAVKENPSFGRYIQQENIGWEV